MAAYDIKQVTRYVLVKKSPTRFGDDLDVSEFKRRDEAEAVLNALKGEAKAAPAAPLDVIRIGDVAITLSGLDGATPREALDLLEARVANAKRAQERRLEKRAEEVRLTQESAERLKVQQAYNAIAMQKHDNLVAAKQAERADWAVKSAERNERIRSAYGCDSIQDC